MKKQTLFLCAFLSVASVMARTYVDVDKNRSGEAPERVTWFQADGVSLPYAATSNGAALNLSWADAVLWQVVSATNVAQLWVSTTGTVENASNGWFRLSANTAQSNVRPGRYFGYALAIETNSAGAITNQFVILAQDVTVKYQPSASASTNSPAYLQWASEELAAMQAQIDALEVGAVVYGTTTNSATRGDWFAVVSNWGNHATAGYALSSALLSYLPSAQAATQYVSVASTAGWETGAHLAWLTASDTNAHDGEARTSIVAVGAVASNAVSNGVASIVIGSPSTPLTVGVHVSKLVDTGNGNARGYLDDSILSRGTNASYASYDSAATIIGPTNYGHIVFYQARGGVTITGSVSALYGYYYSPTIGHGHVTNAYGAYIRQPQGTGTVDNATAVFIEEYTRGGEGNYAIYTDGSTPSRFGSIALGTNAAVSNWPASGGGIADGDSISALTITNLTATAIDIVDQELGGTNVVRAVEYNPSGNGWVVAGREDFQQSMLNWDSATNGPLPGCAILPVDPATSNAWITGAYEFYAITSNLTPVNLCISNTVRRIGYSVTMLSTQAVRLATNMVRIGSAWTPSGTNLVVVWPHCDAALWRIKGQAQ